MLREYFWQDLWLRFWWEFSEAPASIALLFACLAFYFSNTFYRIRKCEGVGFSIRGLDDCLDLGKIIFFTTIFFMIILSPRVYPYVYEHSPNTPFKEELRTNDIDQGSTVWVIKRDEQNLPIDVEEHVVFGKTTDYVIIYQTIPYNETTVDQQNVLLHVPINDCYPSKEEAEAFLEATSEEKK